MLERVLVDGVRGKSVIVNTDREICTNCQRKPKTHRDYIHVHIFAAVMQTAFDTGGHVNGAPRPEKS